MRHVILAFAVLLFTVPAHAVIPEGGEIAFQILRNGKDFGEHVVRFENEGEKTRVLIDIDMEYDLGPVTLFKYEHSNEEVWRGDEIVSLKSKTNDDGKAYAVDASWGKGVEVEANGERFEAPESLYTTSYWNPVTLKSDKLLNTQKGEVEDVRIQYVGQERFQTASETIDADHYKISASLPLEVWYDAKTKQWVGLKFAVRGSEIEYKRLTPVQ